MKRYTFTCVLSYGDDVDDPKRYVDMALTYGDKHQDFVLQSQGEIQEEEMREDD